MSQTTSSAPPEADQWDILARATIRKPGEFTIGEDYSSIKKNTYTVLRLAPGTVRNATCLQVFVDYLNELQSLDNRVSAEDFWAAMKKGQRSPEECQEITKKHLDKMLGKPL